LYINIKLPVKVVDKSIMVFFTNPFCDRGISNRWLICVAPEWRDFSQKNYGNSGSALSLAHVRPIPITVNEALKAPQKKIVSRSQRSKQKIQEQSLFRRLPWGFTPLAGWNRSRLHGRPAFRLLRTISVYRRRPAVSRVSTGNLRQPDHREAVWQEN